MVTTEDEQEFIDQILDEQYCRHRYQYLVQWHGWGLEEDQWLAGHKISDTEALDIWARMTWMSDCSWMRV